MIRIYHWFFKRAKVKKEKPKRALDISKVEQKKLKLEAKLKALNEIEEELKTILK